MKHLIELIGIDPKAYGPHSCRKGAASAAIAAKVALHLAKRHGSWTSDAVFVYVHDTLAEKLLVSRAIF